MKRIKLLGLIAMIFVLCGCQSKYIGTWCRYSDTPTTLVIFKDDITDEQINKLVEYVKTIEDLKSYDVIPIIEGSSRMLTVYYQKEDNMEKFEEEIKKFEGISQTKSTKVNTPVDKLVIKGNNKYVYDTSLNNLSAMEYNGIYEIDKNVLKLDNETVFYYKNKFLCYDKDCNTILTKSNKTDC